MISFGSSLFHSVSNDCPLILIDSRSIVEDFHPRSIHPSLIFDDFHSICNGVVGFPLILFDFHDSHLMFNELNWIRLH